MLGAIIGDIIGSRFEFNKPRIKTKTFELFTKETHFTDDTILTIASADAILRDITYGEAYKEWGRKYYHAGWGQSFRTWIMTTSYKPYGSWGNGSAMRVSPIPLQFRNAKNYDTDSIAQTILDECKKSAECTHDHDEGIKGAQSTGLAIWLADRKVPKKDIANYIEITMQYNLTKTLDDIRPYYKFEVSCQKSVPQSIIAFLEANDFEDAIRNVISLGGDTDTMGAITGAIAEMYYGIPRWLAKKALLHLPREMVEVIKAFYKKYNIETIH